MIITRSSLAALTVGFRSNFMAGLSAVEPAWKQFATEVPSATSEELYPWLQQIPGMREWIGERQIKNIQGDAYKLVNRRWEDTISVNGDAIEDDKFGVYAPLFEMLGDAAARQPDELIFATMKAGFSTNCFDGQFFFDTDHPVLDANGAETSVSNMQAGAGAPWFLFDTTKKLKPFIFQNRAKPTFTSKDDPRDDHVFMRAEYLYGAASRNTAGFGFWQTAFGSKATLNKTNFEAAYDAMTKFKRDYGAPLSITPNVLVTGPDNRAAAEDILLKINLANGESNVNFKRVELRIIAQLA